MCGLVGIAGSIGAKDEKAFRDLLIVDAVRGMHSTGVLSVDVKGEAKIAKAVGDPYCLLLNSDFQTLTRNKTHNVLLGHNRYATKGGINKVTAHPFDFENLAGAHNGTLRQQSLLDDSLNFEVDSENLYHHMNKNGVEDTSKKLNGAYALTWYDKQEGTVNFLRNSERTLFYTFTTSGKTLYWASEVWMLEGILGKHGVEHGDVQSFKPHDHYKIKVNLGYPSQLDKLDDFVIKPLEYWVAPVVTTYVNHNNKISGSLRNFAGSVEKKEKLAKKRVNFDRVKGFLNKNVKFWCIGWQVDPLEKNVKYLDCRMSDDFSIKLRVYATMGTEFAKRLREKDTLFVGLVKKVSARGDCYCVLDMRTIERDDCILDHDEYWEEEEKYYTGYQGEALTKEKWDARTVHNCAWCSSPADINDAEDLCWIAKSDFICPDCQGQAEVLEMFGQK